MVDINTSAAVAAVLVRGSSGYFDAKIANQAADRAYPTGSRRSPTGPIALLLLAVLFNASAWNVAISLIIGDISLPAKGLLLSLVVIFSCFGLLIVQSVDE